MEGRFICLVVAVHAQLTPVAGLGVSCHDGARQEGVGSSASQRKKGISHDSETLVFCFLFCFVFFMIIELVSPSLVRQL